jgi:hypothetical protein|uniref:Uncharacterized protein n=1 Tax=Desulfomonile tiedjei TaxID=2358 RepID=A0A7C4AT39_9BACT
MKTTESLRLSELTATQGLCKHALSGHAPAGKMCANCYECARCEYDQMLEDTQPVAHGLVASLQLLKAA